MARCAGRQQRERWTAWTFHVSEMEFTNSRMMCRPIHIILNVNGRRMEGKWKGILMIHSLILNSVFQVL